MLILLYFISQRNIIQGMAQSWTPRGKETSKRTPHCPQTCCSSLPGPPEQAVPSIGVESVPHWAVESLLSLM